MAVRPLRYVIAIQSLLAVALPFGIVALLGFFWIMPEITREAQERQLRLARSVGGQVESHLDTVSSVVRAAAALPGINHDYQQHLEALLGAADAMSSLYLLSPSGIVSGMALKNAEQARRNDFGMLDYSGNQLFENVSRAHKPQWSTTFLSLISGGLGVAYAMPGEGGIFVGEIDLTHLTRFLKQISTDRDVLIMIVDHNGQVVADNNGRYTAQQLNIGNIPLIRSGIDTDQPTNGRFTFEGYAMTGSIIQIPAVDWHVLVARTDDSIYRTSRNIALVVLGAILIALSCSVLASVYLARKLAGRFDAMADRAQRFTEGNRDEAWPITSIAEFNQLSGNLQFMGDTLYRQELVLRESENRMTRLYNISQYPFSSESEYLEHALEELLKLTGSAFGFIYFYSEQTRQFTLNSWSNGVMSECAVQEKKTTYDLENTGIWGETVRQRRAILLNDFKAPHPLKKGLPEGHVPLDRFLTIPIMDGDSIVAVAGVGNKQSDYLDSDVMQMTLFMDAVWKIVNRKRGEEERRKMEQQLLHTQKLESLGVLAGGIAHDFNNILTAIIGNADLALMRINRESPAVENLHRIEQAASRAADLAKQMLAYSGKGKFVIEKLDMNRLLQEMLHMLEVSISKKAVLHLNLHKQLPVVEADATQLRQVVMNLVINASEAIGDRSGSISVTTGSMECNRDYLREVWFDEDLEQGLYVFLEISDNGCGMDKETLARIFDPFFTTKFTGRGLGMAAVMGIVRGHKGAIKVYSEPGKGSSFKILLPACANSTEPEKIKAEQGKWRAGGTVLLVDDEKSVREIGSEMLQELGFRVLAANDGRQAMEMYKAEPGIDIVILDLTMPHMDGEQCFRELRQFNSAVRVIISSGFSEHEVARKFAGKGVAGFIQKPYRTSELRTVIGGILEY